MKNITSQLGVANRRITRSVIILYFVVMNFLPSNSVPLQNTCSSLECSEAAAEISAKMDETVAPCDNFYQFVCGNYIKDNTLDGTRMNLLKRVKSNGDKTLDTLLKGNQFIVDRKPFRHVSKLYNICMDQKTQVQQGVEPLREILRELGGWPLLEGDRWSDSGNDWLTISGDVMEKGYHANFFLEFNVVAHPSNPKRRIIHLRAPFIRKISFDDLIERAVILGAERDYVANEVSELKQFELDLINIMKHTRRAKSAELNLKELTTKWPTIDWKLFLTKAFGNSSAASFDEIDSIHVNTLLINNLVIFMENQNSSKLLMNHVLSRVVGQSWEYIRYENSIHPSSNQSASCRHTVFEYLPFSIDSMFALNYVNDEKRNEVIEMMAAIKDQLIGFIQEAKWLDNVMSDKIMERMSSLNASIAFHDWWKNEKKLNELHNGLELGEQNFLRTILAITRFKRRFQYRTGRRHIEDQRRLIPYYKIPSYSSRHNTITIGAQNFQNPLVNIQLPKYMNYGGIGYIMGHEITHGIEHPNSDETIDLFPESSKYKQCLVNQYSNYVSKQNNRKLDGSVSFEENFADNVGIKLAYSTYTNWVARNTPEPKLSYLKYTPKQMFWISWASVWCKRIPPNIKNMVNQYAPSEYRIIGAASNSIHFSQDFNCPVDSKMNPKNKCTIFN